jgi:hypothetical protein
MREGAIGAAIKHMCLTEIPATSAMETIEQGLVTYRRAARSKRD